LTNDKLGEELTVWGGLESSVLLCDIPAVGEALPRVTQPRLVTRLQIKVGDQRCAERFQLDDSGGVGCRSPGLQDPRY
jgi:hypothetical protein